MKKVLFILVALVLVVSLCLIGCTREKPIAPEWILVGLARDIDGPLNVFECGYGGSCYRWFIDTVNADGGIYLSDYDAKVKIKAVVRDFDVMTWDLAAVTEALIETDKVDFIWGGPGTDCIFTQAPICNAAGKVLITLEGGASTMIWEHQIDNWPYVWVTLSFSNWCQIPVLQDMLQAKLGRAPKAYVSYIGEAGQTHGIEYRDEIKNEFGAANVIDAGFHSYWLPDHPGEPEAIIAAAKAALGDPANPNYDICIFPTYPWNVAMLTLALMASDFNPPAILFGPGANAASYAADFGPYVEGILSYVVATEKTSPAMAQMYADIAEQIEKDWDDPALACDPGAYTSGAQMLDYWGPPTYVPGLQMWVKAVENAGNLDSTDVRKELAKFSSTNPCQTFLGDTWFTVFGNGNGGGILACECHPGEIGQWQSGVYEIVGGRHPTATLIYPMTGKWFWLLD